MAPPVDATADGRTSVLRPEDLLVALDESGSAGQMMRRNSDEWDDECGASPYVSAPSTPARLSGSMAPVSPHERPPVDPFDVGEIIEYVEAAHREMVELANSAPSTWTPVHVNGTEHVEIGKRLMSPVSCVRGRGMVDAPCDFVFRLLQQTENLAYIDPKFIEGGAVDDLTPNIQLCRTRYRTGHLMVADREFVYVKGRKELMDRTRILSCRSVDRSDIKRGDYSVRGWIHASGWVLRPVGDQTDVTYLVQIDPRGWVPLWVVNRVCGEEGLNVERLREFCRSLKPK